MGQVPSAVLQPRFLQTLPQELLAGYPELPRLSVSEHGMRVADRLVRYPLSVFASGTRGLVCTVEGRIFGEEQRKIPLLPDP